MDAAILKDLELEVNSEVRRIRARMKASHVHLHDIGMPRQRHVHPQVLSIACDCGVEPLMVSDSRAMRCEARKGGDYRCALCPFRSFPHKRPMRLLDHIASYHVKRTQYVCSGTKQIKVILALHNSDRLEGARAGWHMRTWEQIVSTGVDL